MCSYNYHTLFRIINIFYCSYKIVILNKSNWIKATEMLSVSLTKCVCRFVYSFELGFSLSLMKAVNIDVRWLFVTAAVGAGPHRQSAAPLFVIWWHQSANHKRRQTVLVHMTLYQRICMWKVNKVGFYFVCRWFVSSFWRSSKVIDL